MNKNNTLWSRRIRPLFRTALCVAMLGVVPASVVTACGGAAKVMPTEWPKAPPIAIKLDFKGQNNGGQQFEDAVRGSLTSVFSTAGYNIVADEGLAQVVGQVNISASERDVTGGFIKIGDGKATKTWDVRIDATFTGKVDKALVDKGTAEYSDDLGTADDAAIADIVVQLNTTKKLHKYAVKLDEMEDKTWKEANVKDCQEALAKTSCDNVIAYMETYPTGKYQTEAKKALDDNKIADALNQEDEAWAGADAESCAAPTKATDCDGVQRYLKKYPNGTHRAEAKDALKKSEQKIALLERQQSATLKKERYESCVKSCKRRYRAYSPGSFNILVGRCVQDDCS